MGAIVDLAKRHAVARLARTDQPQFQAMPAASLGDLFGELGIELTRCETPAPEAEELVLELEAKSGAKMRLEARNVAAHSLLELVRAFAS